VIFVNHVLIGSLRWNNNKKSPEQKIWRRALLYFKWSNYYSCKFVWYIS